MTLHVGVTGTRRGCTAAQLWWLNVQLALLDRRSSNSTPMVLHHGDCVGVDQEAHSLARQLGWLTHAHPPEDTKLCAHTQPNNWTDKPLPCLTRDCNIVDSVKVLLAVPSGGFRGRGSGTWYTVKYAMTKSNLDIRIAPWES